MIDEVRFSHVCRNFDQIEKTRGSARKQDALVSFFKSIPALRHNDAFPLLRLLMPKFDREKTYGINVKKIAALYVDANAWPARGRKANQLAQWAEKKLASKASAIPNFTCVLENLMHEEGLVQDSEWTVATVNQFLEELQNLTSHAERLPFWRRIAMQLSSLEHKWLMRIILKDLKLGIGENTILATFHPSGVDWYNSTSDLQLVCRNALQHSASLVSSEVSSVQSISPDNPIQAMLAARVSWQNIEEQMKNGTWAVELKFDGERCLIHKSGDRIRFFSRNQIELSEKYPHYLKALSPYLKQILAETCILDGELVVWDDSLGGFAIFGTNRAGAAGQIPNCHLAYMAFDIIYLDGVALVNLPLHERRKQLQKCISIEVPHRFEISKQETIEKPDQIVTALDHAITQGNEGLMVKNIESSYVPGSRDKDYWMKVKADYLLSNAMCDTLDLIILGVYFSKRNSFLLGVANQDNLDDKSRPKSFFTLLRCGNGFTNKELDMMVERLEPYYCKFDKNSPPSWFEPLPAQFLAPNVAVDPSHSIVLEIKGFEILSTNMQSCGYTVRFPTTVRIRTDKLWHECWKLNDVISIFSGPNRGRICYNVREKLVLASHRTKKSTARKVLACLPSMGKFDVKSVLFEGLRVYVRSSTLRHSTADMQKLVLENGGEIVLNLTKENAKKVDLVVIGDRTVQVENLIRIASSDAEFDIDVVHFTWVEDSIAQSKQLCFYPWYWIHLSQKTKTRLNPIMDVETGVVWGHLPDHETSKQIYACWHPKRPLQSNSNCSFEIYKRVRALLGPVKYGILWTPMTMFRDVIAYAMPECPHEAQHGNPCGEARMIANCIKVYSGQAVSELRSDITHMITCNLSTFKLSKVDIAVTDSMLKTIKVIDKLWLNQCIENRTNRITVISCDTLYSRSLLNAITDKNRLLSSAQA